VLNAQDEIVCAVGIAGPSARLTTERVSSDLRHVHGAARAISAALGFTVPVLSSTNTAIKLDRRSLGRRKRA
jgi:hypothetical protein